MKKLLKFTIILTLAITLGYGTALADKPIKDGDYPGNDSPSGKHFQFNIIGKKNNDISGDDSKGRTIMIPLKTLGTPDYMECEDAQDNEGVILVDDLVPTYSSSVPANNARLYFEKCATCNNFEIADRDAIEDGEATILVPTSMLDPTTKDILFDVYIKVMGKPLQCLEIDGYAYDNTQNLYFWSGSVYLSKKAKTTFMKINEMFDVWWCDTSNCAGTKAEISVFADVFLNYFWELLNDGTKVVQVRIYPR